MKPLQHTADADGRQFLICYVRLHILVQTFHRSYVNTLTLYRHDSHTERTVLSNTISCVQYRPTEFDSSMDWVLGLIRLGRILRDILWIGLNGHIVVIIMLSS